MFVDYSLIMNRLRITFLNPEDVSKYRQILMGLAILEVLFVHWFVFQKLNVRIFHLVYTEGLLFLSGFGLYYSFSNKRDITAFYKKRFQRLYLPFFIMSTPLYLYFLMTIDEYGVDTFIKQLTTIYFWTDGNYGGMWYVAVSLVLYIFFPFVYAFIFLNSNRWKIVLRFLLILLCIVCINTCLYFFNNDIFSYLEIGITKIPIFFVGILFGYGAKNNILSKNTYLFCVFFVFIIYFFIRSINNNNEYLGEACSILQKLVIIPIITFIISLSNDLRIVQLALKLLGWFGKYSLELYIIHLHIFWFLNISQIIDGLSLFWQATLSIVLALILCIPMNLFISKTNSLLSHKFNI